MMTKPTDSSYKAALEGIKAPLGVLLHLIRRDNLEIYDIPIAKITKEYLDYLDRMENLHIAPEGTGWKMTYEGATALDGDFPVNMSGGVLSSNPIGASGMLRFAESANQVRGLAGEHQVDGARKALGHAYGGGSQYFSMWIVGDQPR